MRIDITDRDWYAALTLLERHAVLPVHLPVDGLQADAEGLEQDKGLARPALETGHRWRRWRHDGPLAQQALFAKRLAADGLTEDRLHQLIHAPVDAVRRACPQPPSWLRRLSVAVDGPPANSEITFARAGQHNRSGIPACVREACSGFLSLVEPLVAHAYSMFRTQVARALRGNLEAPCTPQTADRLFFDGLEQQLLPLINRTLVLELNVARLRGALRGRTPSARFANFVATLRHPEVAACILKEYPVLTRIVLDALEVRVTFLVRLIRDLCRDWHAIVATWPNLGATKLRQVSGALGDPHRGGRAVVRVSFLPRGELIYKPKSLAIDRHMQSLLRWLNGRGASPAFRTMRLLDREDHGWIECVRNEPCEMPAQVTSFYERLGSLLAILYALEATDFHYENIVAFGEHPMLVDLEALFHARGEMPRDDSAQSKAIESLWRSVLRVGLLPQRILCGGGFEGIDLSGVGGQSGQRLPQMIPGWEGAGTDEMRVVERIGTLPAAHNRPTLRGQPIDPLSQTEAFVRGFGAMYTLLRDNRDALLDQTGPIQACAHDEIRTILRPTRVYTWLLQERTHPDVLRNGLDQDRLLDWLWIDVAAQPRLARVVTAEREDLRRGDVPFFTTTPSSRAIWTSSGERLPHFHECSGMAGVEQRIRELSQKDLDRQRWFLRASFTSLARPEDPVPTGRLMGTSTPVPRREFLSAACQVADRLEQLAFTTDTEASWIGVTLVAEQHWSLVPSGVDLYGGLPGIALFLARLASVTKEAHHRQLARKAMAGALRQLDSTTPSPLVGIFGGQAGIIYALAHLGLLLSDAVLLDRAEQLVPTLQNAIASDTHFDVINGSAGAILALAALRAVTGSRASLAAIRVAADHLLAHTESTENGVGWRTPLTGERPLVGCSHGVAGIALALLTAWGLTEDARFERTARAAMAYERAMYSTQARNWPDLRPAIAETARPAMTAWCHGAPGIGLMRLAGLRYADDSNIRDDVARAVHATLSHGFGRSHCLCHGDLGNIELLLNAAARVNEPGLQGSAACFAARILANIRERGWRCGVPLQVETPGLMMGLAGIGDGLLRIAEPTLPSILMLQTP